MRVDFNENDEDKEEPEVMEPGNITDMPVDSPTPKQSKERGARTNKHKVKPRFHDAQEHPPDEAFHNSINDDDAWKKDFGPKITANELDQSHAARRKKLT